MVCPPRHGVQLRDTLLPGENANRSKWQARTKRSSCRKTIHPASAPHAPPDKFPSPSTRGARECTPVPFPERPESRAHETPAPPCRIRSTPLAPCFLFPRAPPAHRSLTRRTNFNPDQTSVTAHTFTSTNPASSPTSRTMFSFRSVTTPELFLGQLTHNIPAGASSLLIRLKSLANSAFDFVNTIAKSSGALPLLTFSQPARVMLNSASTSGPAFGR